MWEGGGLVDLQSFSTIKKALALFNSDFGCDWMMKFLRSLYDHTIYIYISLKCPRDKIYNPCPEGSGRERHL